MIFVRGRIQFRWNQWNRDHATIHGLAEWECEHLVEHAQPPHPQSIGDGKYLVVRQTPGGMYAQAIFIYSPPGVVYIVHARPLTQRERHRFRRRRR